MDLVLFQDSGYLTECSKARKKRVPTNDVQHTLKQEPTTELIKEIAVLELEVVYLENHLLSLYRKAFGQQSFPASASTKEERPKSLLKTPRERFIEGFKPECLTERGCSPVQSIDHEFDRPQKEQNGNELQSSGKGYNVSQLEGKYVDSGVCHSQSSLTQCSVFTTRASPSSESLTISERACHYQPLSVMKYDRRVDGSSNIISLAEHLGTDISHHIPDTPNRLSEDMIKCMSAIYCRLAEPPIANPGLSSPSSSLSSMSAFSIGDRGDMWSPGFRNNSSFDARLDNPFHVEGQKEFSGPYSTMVEVLWIYRETQKLGDTEQLLQKFRSLIYRLEEVDPGKLKHEEKLAFWINIHNALAILDYGIPPNNVRRVFLLLKAAYNIGGHTVSADTIKNTILGCTMSHPGKLLRTFFSMTKFRVGDGRQAYAIEHPEPLLHFALCSGNHSDPAARVYTPKRVFHDLEVAKEEYIQATFGVRNHQKILLPKLVESFTKESGLCHSGVMEMIQQSLPESLRKSVEKYHLAKSRKSIEWIPHNFTFRYLIPKQLIK
ncbi:hypothetical protein TanjilG_14266 [Lupinus angustifolius]|uniref:DUF547 domain-containing protein n=1 Tax=Lupinus angustifolius TaxID=3871 RepID=A0A1J7HA47_LUPAN|nr:hypothetical protein TanjilG_14266 [Lupinus angustifolius]